MGIETMFKDYKKGGYNLEVSKANTPRLTNLILLIAIAYTHKTLMGEIIKKKGIQKYIDRQKEKKRKTKRNSDFWIGLYGKIWVNNYDQYFEEINQIMNLNKNKLSFYYLGLKVKDKMNKIYNM